MNHTTETILHEAGLHTANATFYRGRPILITENDYIHKLFNGDTSILLHAPETAFAMTIHKSQGSEFYRVLMVLPTDNTLLLTRELIYTGITRARQAVTVLSDEQVFSAAVKRRTERRSGLRQRLVNG